MFKKIAFFRIAMRSLPGSAAFVLAFSLSASAGPYTETGIQNTSASIVGWADGYTDLIRGPMDIADPGGGTVTYGSPLNAVGPASCSYTDVVSLGDDGEITMTFDPPITNGAGADFAVFENSFYSGGNLFAELAFVEVSSDGVQFARFPGVSLTSGPVDGYGTLDPTNVFNLAGKHPGSNVTPCQGTPFDLSQLAADPLVLGGQVDLGQIRYVRVVDVIGDGSTYDGSGRRVYDPYPTNFSQGGFDLQAVAVLNELACTDDDEDGFAVEGGACGPADCDDGDPLTYPGATEDPGPPDRNCNGDSDCFIATAAFGSPLSGKIDVLRSFRDGVLMRSAEGRALVAFYYRHAPPWAHWIAEHESLRWLARALLAPVIGMAWILSGLA
ncbi:MAG: putative metal-binding motif-containing protein [bacterium]